MDTQFKVPDAWRHVFPGSGHRCVRVEEVGGGVVGGNSR